MPFSYLSHLECSECGKAFSPSLPQTICPDCQAPLFARYDLPSLAAQVPREKMDNIHSMWCWHVVLPVLTQEHVVTLGEGGTPLLKLERLASKYNLKALYLKDEGLNPTASFKARGLSAAVSKARELGIRQLMIPTAGNAGGALAAYASRAGMSAWIAMPEDTPKANVEETAITGARISLVPGVISDAAKFLQSHAEKGKWFDVSTFKEPYRLEGKKTMGYEIARDLGWEFPEVILYPTGGGTGLVGIWKAYEELLELGWLKNPRPPRLYAVQSEGCAPVVKAFKNGESDVAFWENASTHASGLRVPRPFAGKAILRTLRNSKGGAISVEEDSIRKAQKDIAQLEGIFTAPEGAATLAGLEILLAEGEIQPDERILLLNTGSGLKYLDTLQA
ncbi:threonine synthase [Anaerolinea thermophila]|uniref:Threonine synthase n=1 Tax=Anaerolinea thermophila (strain DSM 14523 / JCM 11388 / NBRC 100420 / UNI-1) TaxID=926569 RepID=E8N6F2_ANATU|nr:threonine synthase [Anaerolinea thermophila]BAJ64016.1 threonine synthase [Anaerolinea thermophila UNI-1]